MTARAESYVYVLFRANGSPFYVGKGRGRRWKQHEMRARNGERSHRANLIRKMLAAGLTEIPSVKIAECLTDVQALNYEVAFIAAIGREPHGPLINQTAGGDGVADPPAAVRAKIAAAQLGRIPSAEARARMSARGRDRTFSPEHRANIRAAKTGHTPSTETRVKISAARKGQIPWNRGRTHSAETCVKLAIAGRGRIVSPETRTKLAIARRGRTHSAETRAKLRDHVPWNKGRSTL